MHSKSISKCFYLYNVLILMWLVHVNFCSIVTPKNFTEGTCLIISLFIFIVICESCDIFLQLKMTIFVLDALIDNLFALSH